MRRPPSKSLRWRCRLKSTRLSLAAGLGSSLLCFIFWLGWQRDLRPQQLQAVSLQYTAPLSVMATSPQKSHHHFAEVLEDSEFWSAAKYGSPSKLLPLLDTDRKTNAAVTFGLQGTAPFNHNYAQHSRCVAYQHIHPQLGMTVCQCVRVQSTSLCRSRSEQLLASCQALWQHDTAQSR